MSTPNKPWEGARHSNSTMPVHGHSSGQGGSPSIPRNVLNSNAAHLSSHPSGNVRSAPLPPLPQRPPQLAMALQNRPTYGMAHSMLGGYPGLSGYRGYGSSYGGYGSSYGGYGGYGGYSGSLYNSGGYGYGGAYGQNGYSFENRFLQAAEESSRGAFHSVESVVQTFASVSMMLESTYYAMYSSFRAILGVVDNFSRLRQMLSQFFSAITFLTLIRNFYRRLLYWLGVMDKGPQADEAWAAASASASSAGAGELAACPQLPASSSWPLFTFIGLLVGGPYLISKLFPSGSDIVEPPKKWDRAKGLWFQAVYPHKASSPCELSFGEGELLNVAPAENQLPENNGWVLAANRHAQTGYAPVNRLVRVNVRENSFDQS